MPASRDYAGLDVLVVDASAFWRHLLRTLLAANGCRRTRVAADRREALALIERTPPDALLLDIAAPEAGGIDVLRDIRRPEHVCWWLPVVVLASQPTRSEVLAAAIAGAHEIVCKPISAAGLAAILASALAPRPFIHSTTYFGPVPRRGATAREASEREVPTVIDRRGRGRVALL